MSDDATKLPVSWAEVANILAEGGVPKLLAGAAGEALSRLIAGAADIPAAWLEKKAQAIRDEKDARSTVIKAIGAAAANGAAQNPEVVDRALDRYIGELVRGQINREAVASKTAEALALNPPPIEQTSPVGDDWMNVFSRHAGNASSERLREIFAQALAGEIRKPGAISLATLSLIAVLDEPIAASMNKLFTVILDRELLISSAVMKALTFDEIFDLEQLGIISTGGNQMTTTRSLRNGKAMFAFGKVIFVATYEQSRRAVAFGTYKLSRTGQEIASLTKSDANVDAIASAIWETLCPERLQMGALFESEGEQYVTALADLPKPN